MYVSRAHYIIEPTFFAGVARSRSPVSQAVGVEIATLAAACHDCGSSIARFICIFELWYFVYTLRTFCTVEQGFFVRVAHIRPRNVGAAIAMGAANGVAASDICQSDPEHLGVVLKIWNLHRHLCTHKRGASVIRIAFAAAHPSIP
mmetsp:Transcript_71848/g.181788  ORF Transcript_71848/g.181788 Transcript_71848/m.181788 type:complete len:146 (+) Transcript_71848:496-933(+)